MNRNIGKIICTAGATCRNFPVEILTCLFFFISQELHIGGAGAEPLMFLPYAFAIVLSINQLTVVSGFRVAYYASFLVTIPLAVTDLLKFLSTSGYMACMLLAIFMVLLSGRSRGNREIARYFSSMVTNIAFSLLLTVVVCIVAAIIFNTISFIFNIWTGWSRHIPEFIFSVILPLTFCMFHYRTESDDCQWSMSRIAEIAVKFIICPAIIIYTAILYIYLIEITFTAELPKGGVAAMIIAFYAIALAAKLLYSSTDSNNFNWFFNRFHYISIPLIVLFAVGISYRIRQYGFTEERVYLVVAGVAMSLFSAMMMCRRTASYRAMMMIASAFIVASTLIPGINAKHMGIKCQTQRMLGLAMQIGILQDNSTIFVANAIMANSTDKDYEQICDCYYYLRKALGDEETERRFGLLPGTSAERESASYEFRLREGVDCSAYPYLLSNAEVDVYDNGLLKVSIDGETIYEYMLDKEYFINHASDDSRFDQNRLIVSDENLMVVIKSLSIDNSVFDVDALVFSAMNRLND